MVSDVKVRGSAGWNSIYGGIAVPGSVKGAKADLSFRSLTGLVDPQDATKFIRNLANDAWLPLDVSGASFTLKDYYSFQNIEVPPDPGIPPLPISITFDVGEAKPFRGLWFVVSQTSGSSRVRKIILSVNGEIVPSMFWQDGVFSNQTSWQMFYLDGSDIGGIIDVIINSDLDETRAQGFLLAAYSAEFGERQFNGLFLTADVSLDGGGQKVASLVTEVGQYPDEYVVVLAVSAAEMLTAGVFSSTITPAVIDEGSFEVAPVLTIPPDADRIIFNTGVWPPLPTPPVRPFTLDTLGQGGEVTSFKSQIRYGPYTRLEHGVLEMPDKTAEVSTVVVPLGKEAPNRQLLVLLSGFHQYAAEPTVTCNINGAPATLLHILGSVSNGSPYAHSTGVFLASVPTGATATVEYTLAGVGFIQGKQIEFESIYVGEGQVYQDSLSFYETRNVVNGTSKNYSELVGDYKLFSFSITMSALFAFEPYQTATFVAEVLTNGRLWYPVVAPSSVPVNSNWYGSANNIAVEGTNPIESVVHTPVLSGTAAGTHTYINVTFATAVVANSIPALPPPVTSGP